MAKKTGATTVAYAEAKKAARAVHAEQVFANKARKVAAVCARTGCMRKDAARAVDAVLAEQSAREAKSLRKALAALPYGAAVVLDQRNGKATTRTLGDAEAIVARLMATPMSSVADGIEYQCDDGGGVPRGYGYAAETDYYSALRADGRLVVRVVRTKARSAPFGKVSPPTDYRPDLKMVREVVAHGRRVVVMPTSIPTTPELGVALDANQGPHESR